MDTPSGMEIAEFLWERRIFSNDSEEGFGIPGCEPGRRPTDGSYCYVWVEATSDHDIDFFMLVDVRTSTGPGGETRDYLFVPSEHSEGKRDVTWHQRPIEFKTPVQVHRDRHHVGLLWFADQIEAWFQDHHPLNASDLKAAEAHPWGAPERNRRD